MVQIRRETARLLFDVRGRDRVRWLHNLCTNDILMLATGRRGETFGRGERVTLDRTPEGAGCLAAVANRQGKMIAETHVRLFAERIELETSEPLLADHLRKTIIMEDVTVEPSDAPVWRAFGLEVGIPLFNHLNGRSPTPFGVSIVGDPPAGAHPMSDSEYDARRIEAGWPLWGVDMDATLLPMEAGLEPVAISYSKGCYVGQEVIQRVKTYSEAPRRIVALEGDAPLAAGSVIVNDMEVGRVTSAAGNRALALVRKEWKEPGARVTAGGVPAVVRPLAWQKALGVS